MRLRGLSKTKPHFILGLLVVFLLCSFTVFPLLNKITYSRETFEADDIALNAALSMEGVQKNESEETVEKKSEAVISPISTSSATHLPTPSPMKAIYMTSWVAGTQSLRTKLINVLDTTAANAIVIDIKDYTGKISFIPRDPELLASGVGERRIADIDELIKTLHDKGVYVIGRVAVFQDPFMVGKYPEIAVHRQSDGGVWKDRKGISWIDAGSEKQWDHIARIAQESYNRGFDEINFDYVRYPSDGDMKDIAFPVSGNKVKHEVIKSFLAGMKDRLKPTGMVLSADFFGLTTVAADDLGIGQKLEDALLTMDYVYPMVYPSHFASGWNNFKNPAEHPYETIKISMQGAIAKAHALGKPKTTVSTGVGSSTASTTVAVVQTGELSALSKEYAAKIIPWLQDFNLGTTYDTPMIQKQIQGARDAGIDSWLMWSPSNVYHTDALGL